MGAFDVYGGHFAPAGLIKIEEGGSHEENPYGGVQLGVDEQGIPNMVEENEIIYDDFVFSDNIRANKSILKEAVLPEKYSGKLYSEIADIIIDEIEERPNDPIAAKGMRAMLSRLANAQETQKMRSEKRDITTAGEQYARGGAFSTAPRYAGVVGSGLQALTTAAQSPDRYELTPYAPVLPNASLYLDRRSYSPVDQNMLANAVLAEAAGQRRAIQNAGLGASTGAALLASGRNTSTALGDSFLRAWQANEQQKADVVAANNAAASAKAQFDLGLSSARANIRNQAKLQNMQNSLYLQRLNAQAEQDKYNALAGNLNNLYQGLAGIGRENFAINQINSNSELGWYAGPNGWNYYKGAPGSANTPFVPYGPVVSASTVGVRSTGNEEIYDVIDGELVRRARSRKCGGHLKKYKK